MCLKTLLGVWKICSLKSSFVKNLLQIHDTSWIHFFFLMYTAFIWYALCSHQMLSFYTRSILKFLLDPPSYVSVFFYFSNINFSIEPWKFYLFHLMWRNSILVSIKEVPCTECRLLIFANRNKEKTNLYTMHPQSHF